MSYADIRILPSADNSFYLEYNLPGEYPKPSFSCTDGKLTLTQENREPIAIIGFGFHDSQSSEREVTLYVPSKAELNSCKLYSDSGNIQEIFGLDNKIAVCDPVYPVYVDTNVMAGRTGIIIQTRRIMTA